jgi:hypothetical protein
MSALPEHFSHKETSNNSREGEPQITWNETTYPKTPTPEPPLSSPPDTPTMMTSDESEKIFAGATIKWWILKEVKEAF